jgi:NAD(P)-dependent dehydrogenase (short-subunit alcohol dehydrogenase family)
MRLQGRVVLVTGAANGIGEATARKLAAEGARLALTDVETERLESVAESLRAEGGDVLTYQHNVTSRAQTEAVFEAVITAWGAPQIVAHIAGIGINHHFLDITDEEWHRTIAVNLTGTFIVTQVGARAMVRAGLPGSIIMMASTNGLVGEEDLADYNASKFGVVGLTKSMAIDLAKHNIRVNSVNPGLIRTRLTQEVWESPDKEGWYTRERIPMRRLGLPEEVANCVLFLASDEASYVTGHSLVVDGGQLTL